MRRAWLATLACVAFCGLSCSIFAPERDGLPHVSAAPSAPGGAHALGETEMAWSRRPATASSRASCWP
jgi:hypothetical protein